MHVLQPMQNDGLKMPTIPVFLSFQVAVVGHTLTHGGLLQ
jgi:hypothetical protein